MKTKLLFTAIILFGFNFLNAQQWSTMAPMPTARASAGVAVVDNLIYVIGGSDATFATKLVEVYDPSTNTWTTKTSMSVPRTELVVATVNGKIYAIGGYNGSSAVNTVEEYDPVTDKWTTKASMPTARSVISGCAVNNKIYVVGGWPGNKATLEEYNPTTNAWSTKTSCSQARHQVNGCVGLNGKIYFIGGKNDLSTIYYKTNEAYDPNTNSWSTYSNLPVGIFAGTATMFLGEIHYFGGGLYQNTTLQLYNTHYVFNPSSNLWTTGLEMLSSRFKHVSAVVDNKTYVIGGVNSTGKLINTNERYDSRICIQSITVTDTLIISTGSLGNNPLTYNNTITIYPNPAKDHITIDCGNIANVVGYHIEISNSLGQVLFNQPMNTQQYNVALNSWSGNGMYFVKVFDAQNNELTTRKIILQ